MPGGFCIQTFHGPKTRSGSMRRGMLSMAHAAMQRAGKQALSTPGAGLRQAQHPSSAYVHLPFCKRKCFYCDFPISVVGSKPELPGKSAPREHSPCRSTGPSHLLNIPSLSSKTAFAKVSTASAGVQQSMEEYVQLLTAEMGAQLQLSEQPLQTIFFGGGTPSLVPPHTLQHILAVLEQQFGIASDAEISMEADPGTFDAQVPRKRHRLPICGQAHCLVVFLYTVSLFAGRPTAWWCCCALGRPSWCCATGWQFMQLAARHCAAQ